MSWRAFEATSTYMWKLRKARKVVSCGQEMSWCMGLSTYHLRSTWAWCTHCNHPFFPRLCNQVYSPARWKDARSLSAKRCAGAMVGLTRRLQWKQSACGAARQTMYCRSWSLCGPQTMDAQRARPPCFADHGCSWRWCAVWLGSWSVGFRFQSPSRQRWSMRTYTPFNEYFFVGLHLHGFVCCPFFCSFYVNSLVNF